METIKNNSIKITPHNLGFFTHAINVSFDKARTKLNLNEKLNEKNDYVEGEERTY